MRKRRDAFVAERISRGELPRRFNPSSALLALFIAKARVVASYIALSSEADLTALTACRS